MARCSEVAQIIGREVRDTDLLGHTDRGHACAGVPRRRLRALRARHQPAGSRYRAPRLPDALRIAVGAACYPTHAVDADSLKRQALSRPLVNWRGGLHAPPPIRTEARQPGGGLCQRVASYNAATHAQQRSRLRLPVSLFLSLPPALFAQDTPTEKEAARDVLKKMAALEQSLDVPALVARLDRRQRGARPGRRAREGADGERAPRHGRRHRHAPRDRIRGETVGRQAHRLSAQARLQRRDGDRRAVDRVRREVQAEQRQPGARRSSSSTTRCAAPKAPSTAISTARRDRSAWRRRSRWPSISTRTKTPGSVIVYGTPGEEMMPPNAKTVMHDGARVRRRRRHRPQPRVVSATSRPAPGFGTCCLNIIGAKYTFSGAPTHQMTPWNGRNALTAVIQLFNNIDAVRVQHPARSADPGHHPRRRHGAERGARSHRRRLLHPLSRRGVPRSRSWSSSTTRRRRRRSRPAPR